MTIEEGLMFAGGRTLDGIRETIPTSWWPYSCTWFEVDEIEYLHVDVRCKIRGREWNGVLDMTTFGNLCLERGIGIHEFQNISQEFRMMLLSMNRRILESLEKPNCLVWGG